MSEPFLEMRLRAPLDRFDLSVEAAFTERVTGLFGPSGSGKTTWLEAIAGLRPAARGWVRCGEETWLDSDRGVRAPPERRGVGYVPQDQRLFPHLDVRGNLRFGAGRGGAAESSARFEEVVEMLDLGPLLGRDVRHLSGGERQRVALGRAIGSGPRLLLLDEPLASLDPALRHRVLPYLKRLRERLDLPMIVVSHHPFELQALCGEVVALRSGAIVTRGAPGKVLTDAAVFPWLGGEGFENVLEGVHVERNTTGSTVRLGSAGDGPILRTRRIRRDVGEALTLGMRAHDLLVAMERVSGTSARNQLPATVVEVREASDGYHVVADIGAGRDTPLVAEVTEESREELGLAPGREVFLLVKTRSISLCGAGEDDVTAGAR